MTQMSASPPVRLLILSCSLGSLRKKSEEGIGVHTMCMTEGSRDELALDLVS